MGLFGGGNAKTTNTTVTRESTVNNVDNRLSEGDGSIGGNVNLNLSELNLQGGGGGDTPADGGGNLDIGITTTDYGALDAASELADKSIAGISQAQSAVSAASTSAIEAVKGIADNTTRDQGAATSRLLVVGAVVLGLGVAFFMFRKRG
jgi:hypothetical protein